MRTQTLVLALFLGACLAPGMASADEAILRDYPLTDLEGNTFQIRDLQGKVVVVNFWASWCKPCRKELPELNGWSGEMEDVEFVAISVDQDERKARPVAEKFASDMTVCLDGADGLARQMDLNFLPCTFVLDTSGRVALVTPGVDDKRMAEMRTVISSLRRTPSTASMEAGR